MLYIRNVTSIILRILDMDMDTVCRASQYIV